MVFLGMFVSAFLVGIGLISFYKDKKWKKETSDWIVGDEIYMKKKNNALILKGWSKQHIYVSKPNEVSVTQYSKNNVDFNKSVLWRRYYDECKDMMNTEPDFVRGLVRDSNTTSGIVDNKPIELLTEIECQVYLKQALESQDFVLAAQLRDQLQKYR